MRENHNHRHQTFPYKIRFFSLSQFCRTHISNSYDLSVPIFGFAKFLCSPSQRLLVLTQLSRPSFSPWLAPLLSWTVHMLARCSRYLPHPPLENENLHSKLFRFSLRLLVQFRWYIFIRPLKLGVTCLGPPLRSLLQCCSICPRLCIAV